MKKSTTCLWHCWVSKMGEFLKFCGLLRKPQLWLYFFQFCLICWNISYLAIGLLQIQFHKKKIWNFVIQNVIVFWIFLSLTIKTFYRKFKVWLMCLSQRDQLELWAESFFSISCFYLGKSKKEGGKSCIYSPTTELSKSWSCKLNLLLIVSQYNSLEKKKIC